MRGLPIQRSRQERQAILETIGRALSERPEVVYAYAHGSILQDRPFHDIDIGIYVQGVEEGEMGMYAVDLSAALQDIVRLPVDVRVLNLAPLGFRYHAFRGQMLCSRDDDLRTAHLEQTAWQYLDVQPLLRQAMKEAMIS